MIYSIIIVLALIIVALFFDWSSVSEKWSKRRPIVPSRKSGNGAQKSAVTHSVDHFPMESPLPIEPEPQPQTDPEIDRLLSEADIHFRKGELKAAENFYLQAAAKDPRCSRAYSRLGVIYLENGEDWEDAEAAFRQALKSDANNGYILNNLGLVLYHQDRYADAIRNFEAAVRQDEQNASRHSNLGMAYMAMRQYAKAESAFKKALKLAPNEMEYKDLLSEAMEKKAAHKSMIRK